MPAVKNTGRKTGSDGLTKDDPIDLAQQATSGNISESPVAGSSSVAGPSITRKRGDESLIKAIVEAKNNRKRQCNSEIQAQTTERLRLSHVHEMEMKRHEMELKRMELEARAAERAHEQWMKESELGFHQVDLGNMSNTTL